MTDQPLSLEQRTAELNAIAAQIRVCQLCGLAKERTHAVPGAGPFDAEIMFIGEGPGFNEDQKGIPFIGASGKFLEEMLAGIGYNRNQVFISNVVKCRPPENRDPLPDEIDICTKTYLYRQIALINPRVVVTLGRYSMGLFFPNAKITAIHGQPKHADGRIYLPMFHPAAVLRNGGLRPQAIADMQKLPGLLAEAKGEMSSSGTPANEPNDPPNTAPPPPQPPSQLSLF